MRKCARRSVRVSERGRRYGRTDTDWTVGEGVTVRHGGERRGKERRSLRRSRAHTVKEREIRGIIDKTRTQGELQSISTAAIALNVPLAWERTDPMYVLDTKGS